MRGRCYDVDSATGPGRLTPTSTPRSVVRGRRDAAVAGWCWAFGSDRFRVRCRRVSSTDAASTSLALLLRSLGVGAVRCDLQVAVVPGDSSGDRAALASCARAAGVAATSEEP